MSDLYRKCPECKGRGSNGKRLPDWRQCKPCEATGFVPVDITATDIQNIQDAIEELTENSPGGNCAFSLGLRRVLGKLTGGS